MKLEIVKSFIGGLQYHIKIKNGLQFDDYTAECLGLTLEEYQKILIAYHANNPQYYFNHYFKNLKDAEKAIEVLEPILIMAELTR